MCVVSEQATAHHRESGFWRNGHRSFAFHSPALFFIDLFFYLIYVWDKSYITRENGMKDDLKIVLDFMLDYGGTGSLPNMDEGSSGDRAYLASLRLAEYMRCVFADKELTSKYERVFERDWDDAKKV